MAHERLPAALLTNTGRSSIDVAHGFAVPGGRGGTNGLARTSACMKKFLHAAALALALCAADASAAHAQAAADRSIELRMRSARTGPPTAQRPRGPRATTEELRTGK